MKWFMCIFMLATLACNSEVTITEDEIGAGVFYAKDSYSAYSGSCFVVFNNTNQVKAKFTYKNGVLHGESLAWYKSGQIRRRGYYCKGLISGKWEFWDEAGNKTIEANYESDNLNGPYISLYANGVVKEKGAFSGNRRFGEWNLYNKEGQLLSSTMP
jgi:antitoxin component YwqK of YwqJK toxin-antitoxin module